MNIPITTFFHCLIETEKLRQQCGVPEGMRWVVQYGNHSPAEVLAVVDGFIYHKRDGKIGKMEVEKFIERWNRWNV